MGWTAQQYRSFAKDLLRGPLDPRSVMHLDWRVREAMLAADVLRIVMSQDVEAVRINDVDALLHGVKAEIEKRSPRFFEP